MLKDTHQERTPFILDKKKIKVIFSSNWGCISIRELGSYVSFVSSFGTLSQGETFFKITMAQKLDAL